MLDASIVGFLQLIIEPFDLLSVITEGLFIKSGQFCAHQIVAHPKAFS